MTETSPQKKGLLQGRVAVVTGAARGIGRATAVALAREGADIIGIDICAAVYPASGVKPSGSDDLKETGKLVEGSGGRWQGLILDHRDIAALRGAAAQMSRSSAASTSFSPMPASRVSSRCLKWRIQIGRSRSTII